MKGPDLAGAMRGRRGAEERARRMRALQIADMDGVAEPSAVRRTAPFTSTAYAEGAGWRLDRVVAAL
jgi:hypothetical protein